MEGIRVSGTFADIYNQIDAKNGFEELQLQNERKFEIPEHQEFKEAYNWNKENRIFYYFTDNCMNEIENNCDSEEDVYNYLIQNGGEEKWGLSDDEYKDVCNSIAPRIMDLMYDLDDGYGYGSVNESKLFPNERLMEGGYTTFRNHLGELDNFYDPYKKEPADVPYEPDFGPSDFSWLFKDIDFSTKEGLEKAANRWESYYYSDFVHDIQHDGDKAGAREAEKALSQLLTSIKKGAVSLGLTEEDTSGSLQKIVKSVRASWERAQAEEKRKADWKAKQEDQKAYDKEHLTELYGEMLEAIREYAEHEEKEFGDNADEEYEDMIRRHFNPDGSLKDRGQYKFAKEYSQYTIGDTKFRPNPLKKLGRMMMRVWVAQFGN